MIVCAYCGAEAEGGDDCPRCGKALPANRSAKALALASILFGVACGLGASVEMIVDYTGHKEFGWSLIGLASSVVAWILVGFPMLTYRKPSLFLPVMGVSILAYLRILERLTGGSWFLSLALPISIAAFASASFSVFLCLRARKHGPNIASFILFGCTLACLAVENILSLHFRGACSFGWSGIVAASALPTAVLLLGIQRRIRPAKPDRLKRLR
jgi:hypothetical protein